MGSRSADRHSTFTILQILSRKTIKKNSKQESNSVNVGQNPKITPSPRKSSLNLNNNDGSLGFKEDPIMGELTCKTCPYQCYGTSKMLKHITTSHSDLIPANVESSSGTPETTCHSDLIPPNA